MMVHLALAALAALGAQGLTVLDRANRRKEKTEAEDAKRLAAHAELYEKDFLVELNMTEAHDKNMLLGVQLDTDTDFTPVSVMKIRKNGLLELWNRQHPERAVHKSDQVMRVNDILWHHNSRTFAERIKSQYKAYKEYKPGAKRVLTLAVQRPRLQPKVRYQSQRDDLHRQMYSKEFVAEIPFVPNHSLGLELQAKNDWTPVSVSKIDHTGLVALWNEDHPEARLYPGDEVIQANEHIWHHNSMKFKNRFEGQSASILTSQNAARPGQNVSKVAMTLKVQRPRSVVEALENRTFQKMFYATLTWNNGSLPMGWTLKTNTTDPISIERIDRRSLISAWNEANPDKRLVVGDRILKLNKAQWHHNKSKFAGNVRKIVDNARPLSPDDKRSRKLTMLVQRYAKVSYTKGWLVEVPAKVGQNLGLKVDALDDELPVTIDKIRTLGAVASFNEDYPEDALIPGDQIFKVNDLMWRQNSRWLASRLEGEFTRSKRMGTLRLWVQRPDYVEFKAEDDEKMDFIEFSTELPVPSVKGMGWELNSTDGSPVSISKILRQGTVRTWNDEHPLKDIQEGDQLIQVDRNSWSNNTRSFMQRFKEQLDAAAKGVGKRSISVLFRRPFDAEPTDEAAPTEQQEEIGEGDVMGAEQ